MILSTGRLEACGRQEIENAYRFCVGHKAPPLPEDDRLAALITLRHLWRLGQPGPAQPSVQHTDLIVYPFRGFIRPTREGCPTHRVVGATANADRNIGEIAGDLGMTTGEVRMVLSSLSRQFGYGVVEHPETKCIRLFARPVRWGDLL